MRVCERYVPDRNNSLSRQQHTFGPNVRSTHTRTGLPTNPQWKGGERAHEQADRQTASERASATQCTFEPNYINKRAAPRWQL